MELYVVSRVSIHTTMSLCPSCTESVTGCDHFDRMTRASWELVMTVSSDHNLTVAHKTSVTCWQLVA